jgi:arylsulfatase A-like enzyme
VLIVLLDDVGFGASSAFGGPRNTPVAERLAAGGLKLNRFHTTALCSPTRQAMLTGRNHHSVGMGGVTEIATSAPGYSGIRPKDKAPAANSRFRNEDPYSKNHGSSSNPTPTAPRGFVMDLVIELLGVGQFRCVRDRIVFQTRMINLPAL